MKRLNATTKVEDGKLLYNEYNCVDCLAAGVAHEVINVTGPPTDRYSTWGAGLPTTMRQCTACKAEDGPWVSASLVGDW